MNFMPIFERELRVRARSRATYWSRFAVGSMGALVWLSLLSWRWPLGAPGAIGPSLLIGVVTTGMVVSCASCLLTADVISAERREGTLDLLLIARVRAIDIVLGKLVSSGLTSLCALVAFMPMLMIPVLAGGVTGGEAFRQGLVLPDTLFLAGAECRFVVLR
jgi:ABC-type Na+ efflux pump permease subunit